MVNSAFISLLLLQAIFQRSVLFAYKRASFYHDSFLSSINDIFDCLYFLGFETASRVGGGVCDSPLNTSFTKFNQKIQKFDMLKKRQSYSEFEELIEKKVSGQL